MSVILCFFWRNQIRSIGTKFFAPKFDTIYLLFYGYEKTTTVHKLYNYNAMISRDVRYIASSLIPNTHTHDIQLSE